VNAKVVRCSLSPGNRCNCSYKKIVCFTSIESMKARAVHNQLNRMLWRRLFSAPALPLYFHVRLQHNPPTPRNDLGTAQFGDFVSPSNSARNRHTFCTLFVPEERLLCLLWTKVSSSWWNGMLSFVAQKNLSWDFSQSRILQSLVEYAEN
jgi:hypothetical protein